MKMLIQLFDPEPERRDGEETGASATREEFAEVKAHFVFTDLDSRPAYDRVVELAIRAKSAFRDSHWRRFNAPNLDTQALRRTSACDIDSMNRHSAGHLLSCPLVPYVPDPAA
jgi:hypothetical protein